MEQVITIFLYFILGEKKKTFQLNIIFLFSELCEQNIEVMLTPEMIKVEFPRLDCKDTKKEK